MLMISLLAPSKTMDFTTPSPQWVCGEAPLFQNDAAMLIERLRRFDDAAIARLMGVSPTLAAQVRNKLNEWGSGHKPALWAYRGDVYKGMYADQLSQDDAVWAQAHVLIMSGLYGVVRPNDLISPYRLEMKTKVAVGEAKDLYSFWGDRLAEAVDARADGVICNLSSDEYARAVTRYSRSRVVTPVFMDHKLNGKVGAVPIYSKMMRGVMARWIIATETDTPDGLHKFSAHDYHYDPSRSTPDSPVFVRQVMRPLQF